MSIDTYWAVVPAVGIVFGLLGSIYLLLTNKPNVLRGELPDERDRP